MSSGYGKTLRTLHAAGRRARMRTRTATTRALLGACAPDRTYRPAGYMFRGRRCHRHRTSSTTGPDSGLPASAAVRCDSWQPGDVLRTRDVAAPRDRARVVRTSSSGRRRTSCCLGEREVEFLVGDFVIAHPAHAEVAHRKRTHHDVLDVGLGASEHRFGESSEF